MAKAVTVKQLPEFRAWFAKVTDKMTRVKILARIDRLKLGNPGDSKSVGEGVHEMRIDFGPGWRLYYTKHGDQVVVLLLGGPKGTQDNDIKKAKELAAKLQAAAEGKRS